MEGLVEWVYVEVVVTLGIVGQLEVIVVEKWVATD